MPGQRDALMEALIIAAAIKQRDGFLQRGNQAATADPLYGI